MRSTSSGDGCAAGAIGSVREGTGKYPAAITVRLSWSVTYTAAEGSIPGAVVASWTTIGGPDVHAGGEGTAASVRVASRSDGGVMGAGPSVVRGSRSRARIVPPGRERTANCARSPRDLRAPRAGRMPPGTRGFGRGRLSPLRHG